MPPSATFRPSRRACPPSSRTCTRSGSWAPRCAGLYVLWPYVLWLTCYGLRAMAILTMVPRCGPSTKLPPARSRPTRSSPSAPRTRRRLGGES
eukprot:scaffold27423_cov64-Phaeocystis_antarctica.AAC.4